MVENSQIIPFFSNQTIFLTGGTGFLGKLLIEKLLRVCWSVKKIYVLVRPKRGKTPHQRFQEVFNDPCFINLKKKNVKEKVCFITGDCNKPALGLSPEDVALLAEETTVVFHVAANVKFEQTLREASYNVTATRDVLELCEKMQNLKIFVYVSTAYSNCVQFDIKEEFYKPPLKPETLFKLIEDLDDTTLEKVTAALLNGWPNTYVYSKIISENLVFKSPLRVPKAVVRPAISNSLPPVPTVKTLDTFSVMNTSKEPLEGWIDNYYGIIGATVGAFVGVVRTIEGNKEIKLNLVPADYACNVILAATWSAANGKDPVIYNFAGPGISCENVTNSLESYYWDFPSAKYLWYKSFKIRDRNWNEVFVFWYFLLACVVDFVLLSVGKPPWVVKKYRSLHKILSLTSHFRTHEWNFEQNNVVKLWRQMSDADQRSFRFDMGDFNWHEYFRGCALGIRLYLLKDPIETLPEGQKKLKRLFVYHYCFIFFCVFLVFALSVYVFNYYGF